MMRTVLSAVLALLLVCPGIVLAQQDSGAKLKAPAATADDSPSSARLSPKSRQLQGAQSQRPAHPRAGEEEPQRRRRGISKKEWIFMGAIAGTSMGIGALAAGGRGLAIGAIVGGWGAYVGHRLWKWVR